MKVTKELKNMSNEGLKEKLGEFKKELLKLNVEVATGANTTSPGKLKQTKKNIARVLTVIKQKEGDK
jgi:large subunit ribosomal protein L29